MEIAKIYALAAGGILIIFYIFRLLSFLSRFKYRLVYIFVLNYLVYPRIYQGLYFTIPLSRYRALI
ncbi:hypothetical protein V2W45_1228792 [Cenococcum geophilum]